MARNKAHIKKDDTVKVLTGKDRGKEGRVLLVDLKKERAIVEGVNVVKKHRKPDQNNPQGSIVEQEASIHLSNLMLVDPKSGKASRIGRKKNEDGKGWVRYAKKSGEIIK